MVDDMDAALRLLAESPVPAALADIDAGVFARIANRRAHDLGRSVIVGAAAFALLAGIGAGLWPIASSTWAWMGSGSIAWRGSSQIYPPERGAPPSRSTRPISADRKSAG